VGAEELRHLTDDVLEIGIVVGCRVGRLDHVEQIAGHSKPSWFVTPSYAGTMRAGNADEVDSAGEGVTADTHALRQGACW